MCLRHGDEKSVAIEINLMNNLASFPVDFFRNDDTCVFYFPPANLSRSSFKIYVPRFPNICTLFTSWKFSYFFFNIYIFSILIVKNIFFSDDHLTLRKFKWFEVWQKKTCRDVLRKCTCP